MGRHWLAVRHGPATRVDQEGIVLADISAMLGHKSTRITHSCLTRTRGRGDVLAGMLPMRYAEVMANQPVESHVDSA
jgi:hypothetical protein